MPDEMAGGGTIWQVAGHLILTCPVPSLHQIHLCDIPSKAIQLVNQYFFLIILSTNFVSIALPTQVFSLQPKLSRLHTSATPPWNVTGAHTLGAHGDTCMQASKF